MMMWLYVIEKLLLSLIVGGGIVLAACVRPFISLALAGNDQAIKETVENISISYWNRYNRLALISISLFALLEVVGLFIHALTSSVSLGLAVAILLMLVRKLVVDSTLRRRLQTNPGAVGSEEQNRGHREVELLSKLIIVLALVLLLWHQ